MLELPGIKPKNWSLTPLKPQKALFSYLCNLDHDWLEFASNNQTSPSNRKFFLFQISQ
jgi:hypothetical protein